MSNDSESKVTAGGIHVLIHQFPRNQGSLILRAQRKDFPEVFILSDDKEMVEAIFLPSALEKVADGAEEKVSSETSDIFVRIIGLVVSTADHGYVHEAPLVQIADLDLVSVEGNTDDERQHQNGGRRPWKWQKDPSLKVQGGLSFSFLSEWTPFLSNEELAGSNAWSRTLFPVNTVEQHNKTVSAFLGHHRAIQTLHRSHSSGSIDLPASGNENVTGSYVAALKEFEAAQMDRQKASLASNAGRETAQGATKILDQHRNALELALSCPATDVLSVDLLCQWHKVLCGDGLHPEAGMLRRKRVHCGLTHFRPPEQAKKDLETVCTSIRTLEPRLIRNSTGNDMDTGLMAATFAAIALLGIVDVHAFVDGNGRLARIAANWALRRAGVPFVIHLFATPMQRVEYTNAIKLSRRNIYLESRGQVTQDQLLGGYRSAGALLPLVQLILNRLEKTVSEFHKVVQEKSSQMTEEVESRAANRFRQRAAEGNCFICFDDNPNIATLCCGKAVHLNCMAEWLSQNNSCPQCRKELPNLPARIVAPPVAAVENTDSQLNEDASTTSFTFETDSTEETGGAAQVPDGGQDDNTTTVDDDTTEESTVAVGQATDGHHSTTAESDGSTEDVETSDDTTIPGQASRPDLPPFCAFGACHNRSARDCSNLACGKCCQSYGSYSCTRHNC